ncbi:MAG: hypothetical protein ISP90_18350 [Nevskia sp.]|nr:hypothetical protein [Nevskia sp.]
MRILIGNTVKTARSDYTFGSREQAEAFFMTLKCRGVPAAGQAPAQPASEPGPARRRPR